MLKDRVWRFTVRDALIFIIILIVAALFIQKFTLARSWDRSVAVFDIVVRGEVQDDFMLDKIEIGDKVYQKGSIAVFGTVTSIAIEPATVDTVDLNTGEYIIDAAAPNKYNLILTLQSTGAASLNGTPIIDNNLITLNQYLVLNTSRVYLPTRVMSIVEKG